MGSRADRSSRVDKSWMGRVSSGRVEDSRMGAHCGSFVSSWVDESWRMGDSRVRSQVGGGCLDVLGCEADDSGRWQFQT
jgi:hypothetical protein